MKSNQQIDPVVDVQAGTVTIAIADGLPPIVFEASKCAPSIMARAALVGMAQVRLIDAAAIGMTDKKTGAIIPAEQRLAMKRERIQALVDHYHTGTEEWSRVREASGVRGGFLFEALCEMYEGKQTPEQVRAFLDGLTDKEQAALREDDEVVPVIARIKAKRNEGQPKLDTKGILGKLGG